MDKVIITIQRRDIPFDQDLELSPTVRVSDLVDTVARSLRWNQNTGDLLMDFEVEAPALKRILNPAETLAEAQLWDGSILIFHPVVRGKKPVVFRAAPREQGSPFDQQPPKPQGDSPVIGWRKASR